MELLAIVVLVGLAVVIFPKLLLVPMRRVLDTAVAFKRGHTSKGEDEDEEK